MASQTSPVPLSILVFFLMCRKLPLFCSSIFQFICHILSVYGTFQPARTFQQWRPTM